MTSPATTPTPSFDINPHLTSEEHDLVHTRLQSLSHAFAAPTRPPRISPGVEHTIHLLDPSPIKQRPYRQSPEKQEAVTKEVKRLLAAGLIQESHSPWSSPVSLVKKADGSWRMVIDYRRVNAKTRKDAYPVPLIEDCLRACKDADWMSIIDIKDAYHHILVALASRGITAFVTPDGLFEWTRMPFGLSNAPATFQRYVDQQLRAFIGKFCAVFFDDCLVYTTGPLSKHLDDVKTVLTKLHDVGLEASATKCHFAYKELLFVGHIVGRGTIKPDPDKLRAIDEFPNPRTVTELKAFLGLANYYRRFIKGFALTASPLYALLKKGVAFELSHDRQQAIIALKKALTGAPCLHAPDFKLPFVLQTDASAQGIGGVLSQHVDGAEHPVGYVSRQLNKAEKNYSPTEWECLAVVWCIGQFEPFLLDKPFAIVTDHSALQWLSTKRMENKRLTRWALTLQEFSYTIQHRPGLLNANADALSRCPRANSAPPDDETDDYALLAQGSRPPHFIRRLAIAYAVRRPHQRPAARAPANTPAPLLEDAHELMHLDTRMLPKLVQEQKTDADFRHMYALLEDESREVISADLSEADKARLRRDSKHFALLDIGNGHRALYYHLGGATRGLSALLPIPPRLAVPRTLRGDLLALYHASPFGGHCGVKHTLRKLATRYYWPSLYADVAAYVGKCTDCQQTKAARRTEERLTGRVPSPSEPWELISLDFAGPLPSAGGFQYILLAIDHFTSYLVTVPLMSMEAAVVIRAISDEIVCKFGTPRRILTDRGSNFTSELTQQFSSILGIRHVYTSAHHPQTNGKIERHVGLVKTTMTTQLQDKEARSRWPEHLQPATFAINCTPNETTIFSPFFLNFGRHPVLPNEFMPDDVAVETLDTYALHIATLVQEAGNYVRIINKHKDEAIREANKAVTNITVYEPGAHVWIQDPRGYSSGHLPALVHRFLGPFIVIRRISSLAYIIRALKNGSPTGPEMTINVAHLRSARADPSSTPRDAAAALRTAATPPPVRQAVATSGPAAAAQQRHNDQPRPAYNVAHFSALEEHPMAYHTRRPTSSNNRA